MSVSYCQGSLKVGVAYSLLRSNFGCAYVWTGFARSTAEQIKGTRPRRSAHAEQPGASPRAAARRRAGRLRRPGAPTGPRPQAGEGRAGAARAGRRERASGLASAAVRHVAPGTARGRPSVPLGRVDSPWTTMEPSPPGCPHSAHRLPPGPRRPCPQCGAPPAASSSVRLCPKGRSKASGPWMARPGGRRPGEGRSRRAGAVALREVRQRRLRSLRRTGFFALLNQWLRGGSPSPAVMGVPITAGDGSSDATCNNRDA